MEAVMIAGGRGPDKDVVASQRAMQAVLEIRKAGRDMMESFAKLDEARDVLKEHQIDFNPTFNEALQSALTVWRRQRAVAESARDRLVGR